MRVAITGASGYVGTCIANCFRAHGHEVLALSRRRCDAPWLPYALGDDPGQLPWDGVDALIHAAYDFTARSWPEILAKNVVPSVALMRAARQANVAGLIFISSMSSFEGCRSNYGKAKLMLEKEALQLAGVVIRPGLVWGTHSGGVMGALEKLVDRSPVVPVLTGRDGLGQYLIHEADLAEAIVTVAERLPSENGALHSIAHAAPMTLLAILKVIAARSTRSRIYLAVPWQAALAGLKFMEALGLRSLFRSDSLVGLVHGNPKPESTAAPAGTCFRPFQ